YLEEAVILTLKEFNLDAGRINGLTGVWMNYKYEIKGRKICAMGVKTSRWVSMHGLALNVSTDLSYFKNIVPCGIVDKEVTSMDKELNKPVEISEVENILLKKISEVFGMEIVVN
ncbi:MAG: lipoyl(octanoyl) transferase LipB, partial [Cytophagaceae bacterium]|nr:lipoyl(octanoyl) transferase LipB [Cytophagaceae bacterium]